MVNCNPETVSTDYDTADRLYFEPLTFEERAGGLLRPNPLPARAVRCRRRHRAARRADPAGPGGAVGEGRRADRRHQAKKAIDLAEDRGRFGEVLRAAGLPAPKFGMPRASSKRAGSPPRSDTRAGAAVLRAGRARHGDRLRRRDAGGFTSPAPPSCRRSTLCWSTGSSRTPSRSTSTRSCDGTEVYIGGIMEHHRGGRHFTPATRPVRYRRSRWAAATSSRCGEPPRPSRTASGVVGCSTCSTRSRTTCSTLRRPIHAPRRTVRSCPRPPPCRWPKRARDHAGAPQPAARGRRARQGGRRCGTRHATRLSPSRKPSCLSIGSASRRRADRLAARPPSEVNG